MNVYIDFEREKSNIKSYLS